MIINTNIYENKIPKEGVHYVCLSVILIDSVFRMGKSYSLQAFLEENNCCKNNYGKGV